MGFKFKHNYNVQQRKNLLVINKIIMAAEFKNLPNKLAFSSHLNFVITSAFSEIIVISGGISKTPSSEVM